MTAPTRYRAARLGLAVAILLLSGAGIAAIGGATGSENHKPGVGVTGIASQTAGGPLGTAQQVDPDTVALRIALTDTADAAWTVEYRIRLADQNTTEAFEEYRNDIRANRSVYTTQFAERMASTVRTAENATGREMALQNVTVEATRRQLPQAYGVVTYRFEWTNFGEQTGDGLRAGDAMAGLFLDSETTLTIAWPDTYGLDNVAPQADDTGERSVTWTGPLDFGTDEPRVLVTTAAAEPTTTQAGQQDGIFGAGWLLLILLVLILLVGVAFWLGDWGIGTTGGGDRADESSESVPPELLTDEEQVLALLEERGGRVKQQEIAGHFEWTDAKTSQVVTRLRENDDVEVLRIGRENVVSLPEETDT